ncbi:MAG: hypothetical protein ACFE96_06895 [Candidatus Hermodarchaeota archaeon]
MKEIIILKKSTESSWYKSWDKRSFGLNIVGFIMIAILTAIFTVFFDIVMMKIGYIYLYFVMIFLMMATYFFLVLLKTKGSATFFFGINGIIGIPIELIIEWDIENTLKTPWSAVFWALIYVAYGLSIDLSFWLSKPKKNERRSVIISSLISSVIIIILSIVALENFYKSAMEVPEFEHFLTYGYFLIPYSIVQGVMGGFLGWYLANFILDKRMQT